MTALRFLSPTAIASVAFDVLNHCILKFYLPSETVETLITNDFDLAKELFRQCYFLKWPVEEDYKLVKEKSD